MMIGIPFLAMVGSIIDVPKKIISFSFVDKKVFYEAVPNKKAREHHFHDSRIDTNGEKSRKKMKCSKTA